MYHRGITRPLALISIFITLASLGSACQSSEPTLSPSDAPGSAPPNGSSGDQGVPAGRTADETYDEARRRHAEDPNAHHTGVGADETPEALARGFSELDLSTLPVWQNDEMLQKGFALAQGDRFLSDPLTENATRRRIPWQYPDDGCFTRAEMAAGHLVQNGYPAPKKIFVFGSLSVSTPQAPGGAAFWWYHVAPAVRVGDVAYVLDPAIESRGALKISDWLAQMSADLSEARIAICTPEAYDAYSSCVGNPPDYARQEAQVDIPALLQSEWDRMIELGRDPRAELLAN